MLFPHQRPQGGVLHLRQCPEGLTASTDKHEVVKQSKLLLMVIPTPFVASTMSARRAEYRCPLIR